MSPLLIPLGLVVGLTLGALGGGGAILTVPVLVHLLGQEPREATTSSLLIVGLTSLIALLPHARKGNVRFGQGLLFGALGTGGSFVGSLMSSRVAPEVLLTAFAGLMLLVASLMLRRSFKGGAVGAHEQHSPEPLLTLRPLTCACPRLAKVVVTASAVGLLTGFFGVGGGFVLVPALVLALAFPMPVAIATSLLVIAVNSTTALVARISTTGADLDWPLITGFTLAAIVGSLVGGRLASRVQPKTLTRAFGVLLVVVSLYTAVRTLPALI